MKYGLLPAQVIRTRRFRITVDAGWGRRGVRDCGEAEKWAWPGSLLSLSDVGRAVRDNLGPFGTAN